MINKKLIIFTAPSGSGKTTILKRLLECFDNLFHAITYTTREPRFGEVDGIDYHFVSVDVFKTMIMDGIFLEYEEVYHNQFYGSSKKIIDDNFSNGKTTMMILDVKGALAIKEICGDDSLIIFIKVSDIETLRQRLIDRGLDDLESIEKRMKRVSKELMYENSYDSVVINDDLETAIEDIKNILYK